MKRISHMTLIAFIVALLLGCTNESTMPPPQPKAEEIEVTINNTEVYELDLGVSGDEERASIISQASHFETSEIVRDSTTQWNAVYRYKAQSGYMGSDTVLIETCTGGTGVDCSDTLLINVHFTVTN